MKNPFKKKMSKAEEKEIDELSEEMLGLIEYQCKNTLLDLIRTGECVRKYCVGSCPIQSVCSKNGMRGILPLKEEAAKEYIRRYGKSDLFENLL